MISSFFDLNAPYYKAPTKLILDILQKASEN